MQQQHPTHSCAVLRVDLVAALFGEVDGSCGQRSAARNHNLVVQGGDEDLPGRAVGRARGVAAQQAAVADVGACARREGGSPKLGGLVNQEGPRYRRVPP